jgi:hypothetical protein
MAQQGVNILADVVIGRARAELLDTMLMFERTGRDPFKPAAASFVSVTNTTPARVNGPVGSRRRATLSALRSCPR